MKAKTLLLAVIAMVSMVSVCNATTYGNPEVDQSVEKYYNADNVVSVKDDGYVVVVELTDETVIRASSKTGKIMEVDILGRGSADGISGTYVGAEFKETLLNVSHLVGDVNHEGINYRTYANYNGSFVRIAVDESNRVAEISSFSKDLNT